jgi:hypothetical protein
MDKPTIIELLTRNYNSFITYINGLTTEEYLFSYRQKWAAGQQLNHIVLCIKPLLQVFSLDSATIAQNFGSTNRPGVSYDELLETYLGKLKEGGKAPDRFVPEIGDVDKRKVLAESLGKMVKDLCSKIEGFTEQELDSLCIPHPLLGNLTMREMLFNVIYHVQHHQSHAIQYLKHILDAECVPRDGNEKITFASGPGLLFFKELREI